MFPSSVAQSSVTEKKDVSKTNKTSGRVLRSRRYKRPFEDTRPVKRLFTPEIKRYLKAWLVRRRENPYPSREEKKDLAVQTGLTYIQICNWFANWRRKLKNAGKSVNKFTWSTLIKSYNNQAMGNVEQLSISSDDSIWEEPEIELGAPKDKGKATHTNHPIDHCYTAMHQTNELLKDTHKTVYENSETNPPVRLSKADPLPQCFQISSTTDFIQEPKKSLKNKRQVSLFNNPLKSNKRIINKYLDGIRKRNSRDKNWNFKRRMEEEEEEGKRTQSVGSRGEIQNSSPGLLSKWRKSAACFQPSCKTYVAVGSTELLRQRIKRVNKMYDNFHGREELDAAEALTFLSRASSTKS